MPKFKNWDTVSLGRYSGFLVHRNGDLWHVEIPNQKRSAIRVPSSTLKHRKKTAAMQKNVEKYKIFFKNKSIKKNI